MNKTIRNWIDSARRKQFGPAARALCLVFAAAMIALLFIGGRQPYAVGLFRPPLDLFAHGVFFGTFTLLGWWGTGGRRPLLLMLAAIAVTTLDEWHQSFLPGRNASSVDAATGIAASLLIVGLLWIASPRRTKPSGVSDNTKRSF